MCIIPQDCEANAASINEDKEEAERTFTCAADGAVVLDVGGQPPAPGSSPVLA